MSETVQNKLLAFLSVINQTKQINNNILNGYKSQWGSLAGQTSTGLKFSNNLNLCLTQPLLVDRRLEVRHGAKTFPRFGDSHSLTLDNDSC